MKIPMPDRPCFTASDLMFISLCTAVLEQDREKATEAAKGLFIELCKADPGLWAISPPPRMPGLGAFMTATALAADYIQVPDLVDRASVHHPQPHLSGVTTDWQVMVRTLGGDELWLTVLERHNDAWLGTVDLDRTAPEAIRLDSKRPIFFGTHHVFDTTLL